MKREIMKLQMKKHTDRGAYVDQSNSFAIINTGRHWWAIVPVIENVIQYGDLTTEYINGTYQDAVSYLNKSLKN
jgi:hypothetical protein